MCPNCRAFITIADRVCPYCNAQLGPRAIDMRASQLAASMMPRANLTSMIVLIVNCTLFLIEVVVGAQLSHTSVLGNVWNVNTAVAIILGAKQGQLIAAGQWWRLITAGILHGGLIHLAMNSYALWILVSEVEQFYGTGRLVVAYVVSTYVGFLFSYLGSPMVPSLGASAAAFGLIGIMLAMTIRRRSDPLVQMVRAQYGQWLIFSLVLSFYSRVDLAAHIGGLIAGFLIGLVAGLPGLPRSPRETLWKILATIAVLVVVYALIQDYFSFQALVRQMQNSDVGPV